MIKTQIPRLGRIGNRKPDSGLQRYHCKDGRVLDGVKELLKKSMTVALPSTLLPLIPTVL